MKLTKEELFEVVKVSLRLDNNAYDIEVSALIEGALADIQSVGYNVNYPIEDGRIVNTIIIYVKMNFGYDNKDSEKQYKIYDTLLSRLALQKWGRSDEVQ